MRTSVRRDAETFREVVICQDEASKSSHKMLFSLQDECYVQSDNLIETILKISAVGVSKLHVAAGWENILKTAVWSCEKPLISEVVALIRRNGVSEDELRPFQNSDINDIFPWLYYANRFDILRRICNAAKTRIEAKIDARRVLVYCHLVSGDTAKIVASSL